MSCPSSGGQAKSERFRGLLQKFNADSKYLEKAFEGGVGTAPPIDVTKLSPAQQVVMDDLWPLLQFLDVLSDYVEEGTIELKHLDVFGMFFERIAESPNLCKWCGANGFPRVIVTAAKVRGEAAKKKG